MKERAAMKEKRISFWKGKIAEILKSADARQLELIYGFAFAFLEKAKDKVN